MEKGKQIADKQMITELQKALNQTRQQLVQANFQVLNYQMQELKAEEAQLGEGAL